MKRFFRKINSGLLVFVLIILLLILNLKGGGKTYNMMDHPLIINLTDRAMDTISDTLPAYRYNRIRDSLKMKFASENIDMISTGQGWSGDYFGSSSYYGLNEHFLNFPGYETGQLNYHFKKDGKIYFHYLDESDNIRIEESKIKFIRDENEKEKGRVLIPVAAGVTKAMNILYPAFLIIMIALAYYILLVTPIRILYSLAKGHAFTDENIGGLHAIAWLLIIAGILPGLFNIISHFFIRSQIPDEIHYSYFNVLMYGWKLTVIGLCILLLAKAFLRGAQLQKEQELTV